MCVAPLCAAMVFLCASVCPFDLINFEINFKNTKHDVQAAIIYTYSHPFSLVIHHIYTIRTYYRYIDSNFIFTIVTRHKKNVELCMLIFYSRCPI